MKNGCQPVLGDETIPAGIIQWVNFCALTSGTLPHFTVLLPLRRFPTRLYQESGREPPLNLQLWMGHGPIHRSFGIGFSAFFRVRYALPCLELIASRL